MATSGSKKGLRPINKIEPENADEVRSALESIAENADSLVVDVFFLDYLLLKEFPGIKALLAELKRPGSPLRALNRFDPVIIKNILSILEKGRPSDVKALAKILDKKIGLAKFKRDEQMYFNENPSSEIIIMASELVKPHDYDIG